MASGGILPRLLPNISPSTVLTRFLLLEHLLPSFGTSPITRVSTRLDERGTLEVIEKVYPGMLEGLAEHEGIGFIMVRSEDRGPVVIGENGRYYLNADQVEGENPLEHFGPNVVSHLKRTDSFPDTPDILVNSFYDPEKKEGAAFEELIGFHGGLGGYQTQPFLLYPAEWDLGTEKIVGAERVYKVLKGKLVDLQKDPAATRSNAQ